MPSYSRCMLCAYFPTRPQAPFILPTFVSQTYREGIGNRQERTTKMRIVLIPALLAMMIACGSQVLSHQVSASAQKPATRDLRTVPGKPLSEGRNRNPFAPLGLITY